MGLTLFHGFDSENEGITSVVLEVPKAGYECPWNGWGVPHSILSAACGFYGASGKYYMRSPFPKRKK